MSDIVDQSEQCINNFWIFIYVYHTWMNSIVSNNPIGIQSGGTDTQTFFLESGKSESKKNSLTMASILT